MEKIQILSGANCFQTQDVCIPGPIRRTPNGDFCLVDEFAHRLLLFDSQGQYTRQIGVRGVHPGQFQYPTDVAFSPKGFCAVTDRWNHRIQFFYTDSFKYSHETGVAGRAPGCLHEPWGIVFFNDSFVVAERENNRLSIFDAFGRFQFVLRCLFGKKEPLMHVSSMAVLGDYFALLDNLNRVLIINTDFHCESTIDISGLVNMPQTLYRVSDNMFSLSSDDGRLFLCSIDGMINSVFSMPDSDDLNAVSFEGFYGREILIIADIRNRKHVFVQVGHDAIGKDAQQGKALQHEITLSETETCTGNCQTNRRVLFPGIEPFLSTRFHQLQKNMPNDQDELKKIVASNAAIKTFQIREQKHAGSREKEYAPIIELKEVIELVVPGMEQYYITSAVKDPAGQIFLSMHPGGLIKVADGAIDIASLHEPETGVWMECLDTDLFVLLTYPGRELLAINSRGEVHYRLASDLPGSGRAEDVSGFYQISRRDESSVFYPNPATGKVEIYDVRQPGKPGGTVPYNFKAPYASAFCSYSNRLYVLDGYKKMIVFDGKMKLLSTWPIKSPHVDYVPKSLAWIPDIGVAVCYYKVNGLHISSQVSFFTFDGHFISSFHCFTRTDISDYEVQYLTRCSQPLFISNTEFLLVDFYKWEMYRFEITGL